MPPGEAAAGTPSVDIAALSPAAAENPEATTRLAQPGSLEELAQSGSRSRQSVSVWTAPHCQPPQALILRWSSGAIEDLFDGANGTANAVPHSVPAIRPPSRHEAIAPIRKENSLSSLLSCAGVICTACDGGLAAYGKAGALFALGPAPPRHAGDDGRQHCGPQDHHHRIQRESNRRERAFERGRQRAVPRRDLARFDPRLQARSCGTKRDRDPRPKTRSGSLARDGCPLCRAERCHHWRVGACRSRRAHCTSRISPAAREQSQFSRRTKMPMPPKPWRRRIRRGARRGG